MTEFNDLNTSILSSQSGLSQEERKSAIESVSFSASSSPKLSQRIKPSKKKDLIKLIGTVVKLEQTRRKDSIMRDQECGTNYTSRKNSEQMFENFYEKLEKIGEGGNSCVHRCRRINDDSQHFAVKITKFSNEEIILSETDTSNRLLKLSHPNVCKAYDLFVEKSFNTTYLIMEYINGQTIEQWIQQKQTIEDNEIRFIMNGLLEGIDYLHQQGFIHRDISSSNVIYDRDCKKVKIIDLSTCKDNKFSPHRKLLTVIGNDIYRAPEMFEGAYHQEVDIWAAGLILFQLLFQKHPFFESGDDQVVLVQKVTQQEIDWDLLQKTNDKVSPCQIDLCQEMLKKNPSDRISAKQALRHPFLKQRLCSKDFSFETRVKSQSIKSIMRIKSCEEFTSETNTKTDTSLHSSSQKITSVEENLSPLRYF
ncbi:Serine/Threonine kinase domain protein (macronuclear) [Tetrahymena thermophila SB210]|uniref:Serine/Threonine kinase domain protein n=1 Tax=Tetrahymena thermophila (strain SB210) TaxID=312017 RepID=I7M6J4_TETTS|nr:Serine/Threonine kinase domain protein [Tetrahymena thermophila SB210]EAR85317.1 Serine/Threonine kinase domain protein [Tetrahymena thermophila SB210]|eukprot:XP_001032980.1 Serine/Threonine kinase domain protein [Tetrahymena thermophila SB210]